MKVYTYWEGEKPFWIELCLNSLRAVFGNDLVVLTPENLIRYVNVDSLLHPNWREVPGIAPKVGMIRVCLINQLGGWWVDADTVALRRLPKIGRRFLHIRWTKNQAVPNGYFGALKEHPVTTTWLKDINKKLDSPEELEKIVKTPWMALGQKLLTPIVNRLPHFCREIPRERIMPVDTSVADWDFLNPGRMEDFVSKETYLFGLVHSFLSEKARGLISKFEKDRENSFVLIHSILDYLERKHGKGYLGGDNLPHLHRPLLRCHGGASIIVIGEVWLAGRTHAA